MSDTNHPPFYLSTPLRIDVSQDLFVHSDSTTEITLYLEAPAFRKALHDAGPHGTVGPISDPGHLSSQYSFDLTPSVRFSDATESHHCRLHAALCCGAKYFSVTLRGLKIMWRTSNDNNRNADSLALLTRPIKTSTRYDLYIATEAQLLQLYENALPDVPRSGLFIFSGGTGTGKTTHLDILLRLIMKHSQSPSRLPHFVFCGDPVESDIFRHGPIQTAEEVMCAPHMSADITPRILGIDTPSVRHALRDALRETPRAYIISELRSEDDISEALSFAETGHLLLTSMHATSLSDCFSKLGKSMGMRKSSGRSELVKRLAAVVHLDRMPVIHNAQSAHEDSIPNAVILPTMWIASTAARNQFVNDGPSALITRNPASLDHHNAGVLGWQWMLKSLMSSTPSRSAALRSLIPAAVAHDLGILNVTEKINSTLGRSTYDS